MRSSMIGLAAATAVGIGVVALPPALAGHSAIVARPAPAAAPSVAAVSRPVTRPVTAGTYPTNTTALTVGPLTRSYAAPAKVTFTGKLRLNRSGIRTDHLRIFSMRKHAEIAVVKTNAAGEWKLSYQVSSSDWFFALYSGTATHEPAMSAVSKITIAHPAAH